jgi:hypothetical protein
LNISVGEIVCPLPLINELGLMRAPTLTTGHGGLALPQPLLAGLQLGTSTVVGRTIGSEPLLRLGRGIDARLQFVEPLGAGLGVHGEADQRDRGGEGVGGWLGHAATRSPEPADCAAMASAITSAR